MIYRNASTLVAPNSQVTAAGNPLVAFFVRLGKKIGASWSAANGTDLTYFGM